MLSRHGSLALIIALLANVCFNISRSNLNLFFYPQFCAQNGEFFFCSKNNQFMTLNITSFFRFRQILRGQVSSNNSLAFDNSNNVLMIARQTSSFTTQLIFKNLKSFATISSKNVSEVGYFIEGNSGLFFNTLTNSLVKFLLINQQIYISPRKLPEVAILEDERLKIKYMKSLSHQFSELRILSAQNVNFSLYNLYDNNFDKYLSQLIILAHGKYIVGINHQKPSVKVYDIPTKKIVFQQILHHPSVILKKYNETHFYVGIGGSSPLIKFYDARNFYDQLNLALNLRYYSGAFANIKLLEDTLFISSKNNENYLTIFKYLEFRFKEIPPPVVQLAQQTQLTCQPPNVIISQKFCVTCHESCYTCYASDPSRCSSCGFGFTISNFTCVSNKYFQIFKHFISFPLVNEAIESLEGLFKFLDSLWLYEYHNMTYSKNVKAIFHIIRKSNEDRFFPTLISNISSLKLPLFRMTNQSVRAQHASPMYVIVSGKGPFFLSNCEMVYLWGTLIALGSLLFMGCLGFLSRKTSLKSLLFKYRLGGFLAMEILAPRISYVTFHCFSQLVVPFSSNFTEKVSLVVCLISFFAVIAYAFGFYIILRWYYKTSEKTIIFCKFLRNCPKTFTYLTVANILNMLQSFVHAFFYYNVTLQLMCLLILVCCHFAILVRSFGIFELVGHFFIYLFNQVTRFMFILILLFHSLKQSDIFQIDIHTTEITSLVMLVVFMHLQVFCNYFITIRRALANAKARKAKEKTQNQEKNDSKKLMQNKSAANLNRRKNREELFLLRNKKVKITAAENSQTSQKNQQFKIYKNQIHQKHERFESNQMLQFEPFNANKTSRNKIRPEKHTSKDFQANFAKISLNFKKRKQL